MGRKSDGNGVLVDALLGAAAGAAAVWVMDRVDWFNFRHEDPEARRRTQSVRPGGMDPAHVAASRAAEAAGYELEPRGADGAGMAVHYALGIAPGALYGALRGRAPGLDAGRGTVFGLGLFVMQDEILNALAGLSAKPNDYPWQAHARGLVAHAIYGLVLDSTLRIADSLREDRDEPRAYPAAQRSLEDVAYPLNA